MMDYSTSCISAAKPCILTNFLATNRGYSSPLSLNSYTRSPTLISRISLGFSRQMKEGGAALCFLTLPKLYIASFCFCFSLRPFSNLYTSFSQFLMLAAEGGLQFAMISGLKVQSLSSSCSLRREWSTSSLLSFVKYKLPTSFFTCDAERVFSCDGGLACSRVVFIICSFSSPRRQSISWYDNSLPAEMYPESQLSFDSPKLSILLLDKYFCRERPASYLLLGLISGWKRKLLSDGSSLAGFLGAAKGVQYFCLSRSHPSTTSSSGRHSSPAQGYLSMYFSLCCPRSGNLQVSSYTISDCLSGCGQKSMVSKDSTQLGKSTRLSRSYSTITSHSWVNTTYSRRLSVSLETQNLPILVTISWKAAQSTSPPYSLTNSLSSFSNLCTKMWQDSTFTLGFDANSRISLYRYSINFSCSLRLMQKLRLQMRT